MTNMRCIVVDDEAPGRDLIKVCMAQDAELEFCGEAEEADSAIGLIEKIHPDLVFLDVQMPEIDGLELLRVLAVEQIEVPLIIFVTAYDKYALRAFEECAVDFLL